MEITALEEKGKGLRRETLKMLAEAKSGHPGGSLSAMDMLVVLYYHQMKGLTPQEPRNKNRDRFVLSKGHACPALYAILADKGYFSKEELHTLRKYGSRLQGQPDCNKTPGVDACAGSLGQGASVAVGMALGAKVAQSDVKIYVMVGDGEIQEGQTWEAAMSAAAYKLDNLTWIVDHNGLQIMGENEDVMSLGNLEEKYKSFGFDVATIDGHDYQQIMEALARPVLGKPKCIISNTVKGKGISFMEGQVKWHGGAISPEQLEQALEELR